MHGGGTLGDLSRLGSIAGFGERLGMRCRPLRWLWGLPVLALVGAIALFGELPYIQKDLGARSVSALQVAGFDWAKVSFDGRDARVTGSATTQQEQQAVLDAVKNTYGVRIVGDEISLIEALKPYAWSLKRDGKTVIIEGYAANSADRKAVGDIAAAQLQGVTLKQNLKLARGMPPREQWLAAVAFAAKQSNGLSKGEVHLDDLGLSIAGTAVSPQAYTAIELALAAQLPQGVVLGKDGVTPPVVKPFVWSATWQNREVQLDGYVPGDGARKRVLEAVDSLFPAAKVTDRMLVAGGAPEGWSGAADIALKQLSQLDNGGAKLTGTDAELHGVAADQDVAEAVALTFDGGVPAGFRATENVTYRKARTPVAKPYTWSAQFTGKELRLEGFVPDDKAKTALSAFANQRFIGDRVLDRTSIAIGSLPGFTQAALATLDQLARLDQGTVRFNDAAVDISGHALDKATAEAAPRAVADALPPGFVPAVRVLYDAPKPVAQLPVKPQEPPKPVAESPKPVKPPEPPKPIKPPEPPKPVVKVTPVEPVKPAAAQPYIWDALAENGTLVLSGTVSSPEDRSLVLNLANSRLPGVKIIDTMTTSGILPSGQLEWMRTVDGGLKAIYDMGGGHARLTDRTLLVTGTTSDRAIPDYLAESLRLGMPPGYGAMSKVTYVAPPALPVYETTLKYDGLKVVVEGAVPSQAAKNQLMARLKPLFPDREFDDRTEIKAGAPDRWFDALALGLGPLSTLDAGQLTLRDRDLIISGTTGDDKTLTAARLKLTTGLPKGFGGKDQLAYVAPPLPDPKVLAKKQDESKYDVKSLMKKSTSLTAPECQAVLNATLRGKAFFATGRSDLDGRAMGALSSVAATARRCPMTRVEISGHTDSDGAAAFNQRLSERRAAAVVKFLTTKGVPADRLSASGLGEAEPISPNDTAAHKANNRRIEFAVTQTQG